MSPQIRAVAIAGGLAALALGLGLYTLSMNQSKSGAAGIAPSPVLSAHHVTKAAVLPASHVAVHRPNPIVVAAKKAGLPGSVARALAEHTVVVVSLGAPNSDVDAIAEAEAQSGAALAGAGFVAVNVAKEGDSTTLTKLLGVLPDPAVLVYKRPYKLFVRIDGFADRQTIAQAAQNGMAPGGS